MLSNIKIDQLSFPVACIEAIVGVKFYEPFFINHSKFRLLLLAFPVQNFAATTAKQSL